MKRLKSIIALFILLFGMFDDGLVVRGATESVNIVDLNASIDENKNVTVTGRITPASARQVTIMIMDPYGNPEYLNSTESLNDGNFKFSYKMLNDKTGRYKVSLGAEGITKIVETYFDYGANANLKNLSVNIGKFDCEFSPEKTFYTVKVDDRVKTIKVIPVAGDNKAVLKVNYKAVLSGSASEAIPLIIGTNTINIIVTAQDGTQKTYKIEVVKDNETNNTSIEATASIDADKKVTICGVLSSGHNQKVTIKINDPKNKIEYVGNILTKEDGTFELKYNMTNNLKGRYTVTIGAVGVKLPLNNYYFDYGIDASLKDLSISKVELAPVFDSDVMYYTATVGKWINELKVCAVAKDVNAILYVNGAKVKSGKQSDPIKIKEGLNTINIVVNAQDGITQKTYNINITKNSAATVDAVVHAKVDKLKTVTITGSLTLGTVNQVSVIVKNPDGMIDYLNSADVSNENGFQFSYKIKSKVYGKYSVTVGAKGITPVASTYFVYDPKNAKLKNLTISSGSLTQAFNPDTNNYEVTVENSVSSMTVTPETSSDNAKIIVNGTEVASKAASSGIPLNVGNTTIIVEIIAEDGTTKNVYCINVNRIALSTDAKLQSFSVSNGKLTPAFNSNTSNYNVTVENNVSSITVAAKASDDNAKIKVNGSVLASATTSGEIPLMVGDNTITVEVIAEDGIKKTVYSIKVNRIALSTDAKLKNLSVSCATLTPAFNPNTSSYNVTVENSVSSTTVTAKTSDDRAEIKVNGSVLASATSSGEIPLKVGDNTITVEVTAEDGTTKNVYSIKVNKIALSTEAKLQNLSISSGTLTPVFNPNTTNYNVTVENSVSSITVTAKASNDKAKIKVNGLMFASTTSSSEIPLKVGDNTITVEVTAEDGTTKNVYNIKVNKIALSSEAKLQNLSINSGTLTPVFSSDTNSYNVTVENIVSSTSVTAKASDIKAKIKVNNVAVASNTASGEIPLKVGDNTITVEVTAEDGTTKKVYYLHIKRLPASTNANLASLVIHSDQVNTIQLNPDSDKVEFYVNVPDDVTVIHIVPTASNENATIKVNGQEIINQNMSGAILLFGGENNIAVEVTAQDGKTKKEYHIIVNRGGINARLKSLIISNQTLSPSFNPDINSYNITVENSVSSMTLTPEASDNTAKIKVNNKSVASKTTSDEIPLKIGDNTITVEVTLADGTKKNVYYIKVSRIALSTDAKLQNLSISSGTLTPPFSTDSNSYNVTVEYNVSSMTVTPEASDNTAKIKVNNKSVASKTASDEIPLKVGNNTITVEVTAEDGITKEVYYLNVKRLPASFNANLASLVISSDQVNTIQLNPDSDKVEFYVNVPDDVSVIHIVPTASNENATIKVNGQEIINQNMSGAILLLGGENSIAVEVTAQDGITKKEYHIIVNRGGINARLKSLIISNHTLSPSFNPDINSYNVTVENSVSSMTVTPEASDNTAKIIVNNKSVASKTASDEIPLKVGDNTIAVEVTLADGTKKNVYYIKVSRIALSTDAKLQNLSISSGTLTPSFSSDTNSYNVTVEYSVCSITVTSGASDNKAVIKVNNAVVTSNTASGEIPLKVGDNTITVEVTAEDGITKNIYSIKVNRTAPSSDAKLLNLSISSGSLAPSFSSDTNGYHVSVENSVNSLTVTAQASDNKAKIKVNNAVVASNTASGEIPLKVGDNTITVEVTAEDGTTQNVYSITVTRIALDTKLLDLSTSKGTLTPTFSPGANSYDVTVDYSVSSITVTPKASNPLATITVNTVAVASNTASGAMPLIVGDNTITVEVTAEDGTTKSVYYLHIKRLPVSADASLSSLMVHIAEPEPVVINLASGETKYYVNVSYDLAIVRVTPTATNEGATILVSGEGVLSGTMSGVMSIHSGENLITVEVTAQDGITKKEYQIIVDRGGIYAKLKGLTISGQTLTPSFSPEVNNYNVTVENSVSSITVTPEVSANMAQINKIKVNNVAVANETASDEIPLKVGDNTITVEVTLADGTKKNVYNIKVNRIALSTDAKLQNLSINSGSLTPSFSSDTNSYNVTVEYSVSSITVTSGASDNKAVIKVNNAVVANNTASGEIPLMVGDNTITVEVTAEDGITKNVYSIKVSRTAPQADAKLQNLSISSGTLTPSFSSDTNGYHVTVENSVSAITVIAQASDNKAKIKVNNAVVASNTASGEIPLYVGDNTITVEVTAEDGTTQNVYSITVTRIALDTKLLELSTSKGTLTPTFSPDIDSYDVTVEYNVSSITVTPKASNPLATIAVNTVAVASNTASSEMPLIVGDNTITVEVTAEDGITKSVYYLHIKRLPVSADASLSSLMVHIAEPEPVVLNLASGETKYYVNVSYDLAIVRVTPTASNEGATILVSGEGVLSGTMSGVMSIHSGENLITVEVTAQDGITKKVYQIIVDRGGIYAKLKGLTISGQTLTPSFSPEVNNYNVTVENSVSSITVTPEVSANIAQINKIKVNNVAVANETASDEIPLKVGDNTITVEVTLADGTKKNVYNIKVNRIALSTDAKLQNLSINSGSLTPSFSSDTNSYNVTVEYSVSSITVTSGASDNKAVIKVNNAVVASNTASGEIPLMVGDNTITVEVTAEDGITKNVYSIKVSRTAPQADAKLLNLSISSGTLTPSFSSDTNGYHATVENSVSAITVTAQASDNKAKIKVNNAVVASNTASGEIPLYVGDNTITVEVTAEDGTTQNVYSITVTRKALDTKLLNLFTSKGTLTPTFSPDINSYDVTVEYNVSSITVTPKASNPLATIAVNTVAVASNTASSEIPLIVGDNTITVEVTAEDGITKSVYYLHIKRPPVSADASLSSLMVHIAEPEPAVLNLASGETKYYVNVSYDLSIVRVTPTASNEGATILVSGEGVLSGTMSGVMSIKSGETLISVEVTAPDKITKKEYQIIIKK